MILDAVLDAEREKVIFDATRRRRGELDLETRLDNTDFEASEHEKVRWDRAVANIAVREGFDYEEGKQRVRRLRKWEG